MKLRNLFIILLLILSSAPALAQTAQSFSTTVSTVGASAIQLQGTVPAGNSLSFGIGGYGSGCNTCTAPQHGTITYADSSTGVVVYRPAANYTGPDSFGFIVYATPTGGGAATISAQATVSLTVTNAKTQLSAALLNPDGTPRSGKVTWILTQPAQSPDGLISASASVSAVLDAQGRFTVQLYPSTALSPQSFYQLWFQPASGLRSELIGIYQIPASASTITDLAPNRVTDANLAARYTFASAAAVNAALAGQTNVSGVPASRQINTSGGIQGGGDLSADRTLSLTSTGVAAGTYNLAIVTVDGQGRVTAASSGATPDANPTFPYWSAGQLGNTSVGYDRGAPGNPSTMRPLTGGGVSLGSAALPFFELYLSGKFVPGSFTFASLGTPSAPAIVFCSDCDPATGAACTSSGAKTGAMAMRINNQWKCY
ncbi:MAG TPA: hypothetical protein VNQ79_15960 [Blastocatellia bacterium]|nr:hypothetical protein [Blastocatellia bacterium]